MKKIRAKHMPKGFDEELSKAKLRHWNALAASTKMEKPSAEVKEARRAILLLIAKEENWKAAAKFARDEQALRLQFYGFQLRQRYLDKMAVKLMTPRPGHKRTLLIWGDGSKRDGFASARCSMGPANALLRHIIRKSKRDDKRNCLVFHADEYRTSKMGLFNRVVSRPLFSDMNRLKRYAACRRPGKCPHDHVHHSHVPGCKCWCSNPGCDRRRQFGNLCAACYEKKPWRIHGLAIDADGRMYNRDVLSAIVIGCRFISKLLGKDIGEYARYTPLTEGPHKAVSFWEDTLKLEGEGKGAPTLMPFKIISKKKKK